MHYTKCTTFLISVVLLFNIIILTFFFTCRDIYKESTNVMKSFGIILIWGLCIIACSNASFIHR